MDEDEMQIAAQTPNKEDRPQPPLCVGDGFTPEQALAVRPLLEGVFQALVDELDDGLILCDELCRPLLINFAARSELMAGGPLLLDNGFLGARDAVCARSLAVAVSAATRLQRRRLLPLPGTGERRFAVVIPLSCGAASYALVLIGRREVCPQLAVEMLAHLHALTPCESQVMSGLIAGRRPAALAAEKGVEMSTVRSQIGAVRAKLGVGSIGEMLRLAARLPTTTTTLRCSVGSA